VKPSETSGGFFLQKSFIFLWRIKKELYVWDMNNTPSTNRGQDEAFRLIVELRKNVFPKMTDEELVSFRKDMAYYLDTKNL
jgi:hypothetical protein